MTLAAPLPMEASMEGELEEAQEVEPAVEAQAAAQQVEPEAAAGREEEPVVGRQAELAEAPASMEARAVASTREAVRSVAHRWPAVRTWEPARCAVSVSSVSVVSAWREHAGRRTATVAAPTISV